MFRLWRRFASSRAPAPRERALALLRRHKYDEAAEAFTTLLMHAELPQERAFLYNKRGVARVALHHVEVAREDFAAADASVDGYAPALTNLGNLLLEEGDVAGAIGRYERAIALDANYALAHLNLSAAYKQAGRHAEAVREFRKATSREGRLSQKKKAAG